MNQQIAAIQKTALRNLYERIKQIVKDMGGTSEEMEDSSSLPNQVCDGLSNSSVTVLHVELPIGLAVDFKPTNPLGFGNALAVRARRTLPSGVLSDMGFSFVNGEWQFGGRTSLEKAILECLTPKGPAPIY